MNKIRIGIWLESNPKIGGGFQYDLTVVSAIKFLVDNYPDEYQMFCYTDKEEWIEEIHRNFGGEINSVLAPMFWFERILQKVLNNTACLGISISRRLYKTSYRFQSYKIFKDKLDVLISPTTGSKLPFILDIPTITPIHDLMHLFSKEVGVSFKKWYGGKTIRSRERIYRRYAKYVDVLLADSEIGKRHILEAYNSILKSKVEVLPFIPPPYILNHNNPSNNVNVINKYRLPETYFFYPAQFVFDKNHKNLIEAVKLLKEKYNLLSLVLCGAKSNNYDQIVRMVQDQSLSDNIYFLDFVSNNEIIQLYKSCYAFIMPTFFGPTNIPIVEALYLGAPIICSDVFSMPEQVKDAALLIDPHSSQDIADKIDLLLKDKNLRESLIANGEKIKSTLELYNFAENMRVIIDKTIKC